MKTTVLSAIENNILHSGSISGESYTSPE